MARFKVVQTFTAGEFSPNAYSRTDLKEYLQGCEEIKNMTVLPIGGAQRRVGTQHVLSQLGSTDVPEGTRLFPFVGSDGTPEIIAITPGATTLSAIGMHRINTSTGVATAAADATETVITIVDADGWEFEGYSALGLSGASDLETSHFAQNNDLFFLVNSKHCPLVISKANGVTQVWNRSAFQLLSERVAYAAADPNIVTKLSPSAVPGITRALNYLTVPYENLNVDTNLTSTPLAVGVVGTSNTVTNAGLPPKIEDATYWIGSFFRVTNGSTSGFIQPVTSARAFLGEMYKVFGGTGATSNWARCDWVNGFPRTVAMFEGRVYYAGGFGKPNKVWASQIGDLGELMSLRPDDDTDFTVLSNDRPFDFALASSEFNKIQWLVAGKTLAIGTNGAEYIASGGDPALALGPLNIDAPKQSTLGSSSIQAIRADEADVFIQRDGRTVREFIFSEDEQNFKSINLSFFADHMVFEMAKERAVITDPKWKYTAYQTDKNIIWLVDNNGGLSGITRDRNFDTKAWHQHRLGGNLGGEPPKVLSIAVVPSPDGTHDEVWMVVQRTIDGLTKNYIEKMGKQFEIDKLFNSSTDIKDKMVYSDSAKLVRLGSPGTAFTGFDHLEGETVDVVADGEFIGTKVVSSGTITLDSEKTEIVAGLNFVSEITPLNLEGGSIIGSSQGTIKRIDEATVRFNRTLGGKIGKKGGTFDEIIFRTQPAPTNVPLDLFEGDVTEDFPAGYEGRAQIVVRQELPLPMTITGIFSRGITYDG